MLTTVLVSTFAPFPTLAFSIAKETSLDDLHDAILSKYPFLPADGLHLSTHSGIWPEGRATVASLSPSDSEIV